MLLPLIDSWTGKIRGGKAQDIMSSEVLITADRDRTLLTRVTLCKSINFLSFPWMTKCRLQTASVISSKDIFGKVG